MAPAEPLDLEDYLQLGAGILALAIFIVAVLAARRRPTRRTMIVTAAFGLYLASAILVSTADFLASRTTGDLLERIAVPIEVAFLLLIVTAFLQG